ncbi:MAG: hypothetical protein ACP5QT_02160 [Brevinematia bacterium]
MKLKLTIVFTMILFVFSVSFSQVEVGVQNITERVKILILPFADRSDEKKFPNSRDNGLIVFYSLYSFIGIVPQVDIVSKNEALGINLKKDDFETYATKNNIDFIIYGEYYLSKGEGRNAKFNVTLNIWSRGTKADIFSKNFTGITGPDIFETADELIAVSLKNILNIGYRVVTVNFKNFDIGDEKYELIFNGKLIEEISNSNFQYTLKVLPDVNNILEIKRKWDGKNAFETTLRLESYASIDVTYSAMGKVSISKLKFKERGREYKVFLDDREVDMIDKEIEAKAGIKHNLTVVDNKDYNVLNEEFYLKDGELKLLTPVVKNPGILHFKLYSLDRNMATLSIDFFTGRYFWIGAGCGGSYFKTDMVELAFVTPVIEAGYYLFNDRAYPFRIGTGIALRGDIKLLDSYGGDSTISRYIYSGGLFLNLETFFLLIRPVVYLTYDAGNFVFSYGIGVGITI